MNNGDWEGPRDMVSYRAAIAWILANENLRWLDHGPLSRGASIIADLFGKPAETVRDDIRTAKAEQTR